MGLLVEWIKFECNKNSVLEEMNFKYTYQMKYYEVTQNL